MRIILSNNTSSLPPISHSPEVAVYTARVGGEGIFRGWPDVEAARAFLRQAVYAARQQFSWVILCTDSQGKELLSALGFDEIVVSLDEFDIPSTIRTACKLDSYARQTRPFLHMDWDFILWNKKEERTAHPVVAQSRLSDAGKSHLSLIWHSLPWKPGFIDSLLKEHAPVELPCPSIFGGTDVDFLRSYAGLALEILRHPKNQHIQELAKGELAEDVCIAMEQWLLGAYARHHGIEIRYLADEPTHQVNSVDPKNTPRLGFTHLSGKAKHSEYWRNEIRRLNAQSQFSDPVSSPRPERLDGDPILLDEIPYRVAIDGPGCPTPLLEGDLNFERIDLSPGDDCRVALPTRLNWIAPANPTGVHMLLEALEEAQRRKVDSFLVVQDDARYGIRAVENLAAVRVPRDWKFIYLIGRNSGEQKPVSNVLARSTRVLGLSAVIIRCDIIAAIKQALLDPASEFDSADARIATLHSQYPAYLCRHGLLYRESESIPSLQDARLRFSALPASSNGFVPAS